MANDKTNSELVIEREYNAATYFIDRHLEEGRGSKVAFIDSKGETSYGELSAQVNKAANLFSSLGMRREDRVAQIMLDTTSFPVVFWGGIKAGVIPVALNTLLTTEQYAYILADCRAKILFISSLLVPMVAPILNDLEFLQRVIVVDGEENENSFEVLMAEQSSEFIAAKTCSDEVAFWLYSSGSTGMPKGVPHIHSSLAQTAVCYGQNVLGISEDDVVFSAAKLFFAYGLGNGMSFPMSVGATTVLFDGRPTPQAVMDLLSEHNPSIYCGVPTLYGAILGDKSIEQHPGSSNLRSCISAGEALPKEIGERWKARFGVDILDGVGSTEMLHIFLSNRPNEVHYGTSGMAVPGYKMKLVDEAGEVVPRGEIGELIVDGPSTTIGYWNQREKNRKTFVGAWAYTGDKYYQDEEGYYCYCGRSDDMFKVSGVWVSPFEVESALITHPKILEAAVVPAEDPDALLKPKAFVILNEGEKETDGLFEDLKEYVKNAVGVWKYPRWIEVVQELPKTATGKIQRFKLRY